MMGVYYWFGCITDKEYIDFDGLKMGEIVGNDFNRLLLSHFISDKCISDEKEFKFLSDSRGDWDMVSEEKWKDVTCDVLIDMFEDGFIPDRWRIGWIYSKFKDNKRLDELSKWIKKFKEGEE